MNSTDRSTCIVVQSHGMGVESQAIFERWLAEPESRPFERWDQLIVVTAQVGEEHKNDTIAHMEARTLPKMRELGIRFVELARRGEYEADGIVVLQDTRSPVRLHPEGVFKLSDELLNNGTVPQFGGEHRCAMKFKAFVIETWLAFEFKGIQKRPVYHVFGYNSDEVSRRNSSDHHIARHNDDRKIESPKTPIEVFGFNSEEIGRVERSRKYDGPERTGCYPLPDWGWNRKKCEDYIFLQSGIRWRKSHCSFCPFCGEAEKGLQAAVERWKSAPDQTAHGLMVEYNALCFNPRGQLYRSKALIEVMREREVTSVLEVFARRLSEVRWGLYRVRRIYTKKGSAIRCVERLGEGTRDEMNVAFADKCKVHPLPVQIVTLREINYGFFAERVKDVYPAMEGFYVVAPLYVGTKVRGSVEKFNEKWVRAIRGESINGETGETHEIQSAQSE